MMKKNNNNNKKQKKTMHQKREEEREGEIRERGVKKNEDVKKMMMKTKG